MANLVVYNKNNDFEELIKQFNYKVKKSNLIFEIKKTVKKIKH